ncbi:hypothetical protein KZX70_13280 [Paenibacillus silvae]|uniref:hypothetical protein n=1 Tax=Paenibacillus silvae TaxID=1325358 RepID=UPI0011AA56C7|nr:MULTISPECIES: hypothetical protein [Paenibacillus]MCK6075820.1 hypothetical protein [Paenibacillus silvae]MCK6150209.1 hypothetical protein [Paenibacillus silvae]MCK6268507.1 hypothetical protein [Paenibacillus silvae]
MDYGLKQEGRQVLLVHPGWVQSYMRGELVASADLTPDASAQHIAARIDQHDNSRENSPHM